MMNNEKFIVSFFGKTGSGKSSLINSVFSTKFNTDNAIACTKELQFFENDEIIAVDTPGIGEELIADEDYFPMYKNVLNNANLILWVFQADTRVYKTDQLALLKFKYEFSQTSKFGILLNQVDLIGRSDWNKKSNSPSRHQEELIKEKISDVRQKFQKVVDFDHNYIIPVSAIYNYQTLTIKSFIYEQARQFYREI